MVWIGIYPHIHCILYSKGSVYLSVAALLGQFSVTMFHFVLSWDILKCREQRSRFHSTRWGEIFLPPGYQVKCTAVLCYVFMHVVTFTHISWLFLKSTCQTKPLSYMPAWGRSGKSHKCLMLQSLIVLIVTATGQTEASPLLLQWCILCLIPIALLSGH